jgi:FlaA1/EpsC-like NDP-sugar epimerase
MWRHTSIKDIGSLLWANFLAQMLIIVVVLIVYGFQGFSQAVFLLDGIICFVCTAGIRVFIRVFIAQHKAGNVSLGHWFHNLRYGVQSGGPTC